MKPQALVYDGLWRCLCPSLSRSALVATLHTPIRESRTRPRLDTQKHLAAARPVIPRAKRCYSGSTAVEFDSIFPPASSPGHVSDDTKNVGGREAPSKRPKPPSCPISTPRGSPDSYTNLPYRTRDLELHPWAKILLMLEEPTEHVLDTVEVPDIHKALLTLRRTAGFNFGVKYSVHDRIIHLATYLVVKRDHYNCPFIYESLMDAAADPAGSAFGALSLWKDYEYRAQLQPTEILCRSALRVCAVHPDYAFRLAIEDTMKQHWFDMKLADHQTVILAMLREKQYELAYTRFLDLVHERPGVELWVYDVMITVFGYNEFLDEMVHIFGLRRDREQHDAQFGSLLYHVLDTSSAAFHYDGTSLAWGLGVTQGSLTLPDGILENVLNTASRGGDPVMGAAAYDMLASRAKLLPDHHHALMESFARAKDFPGLFQALYLVQNHELSSDDLHKLALRLCRNPELHTEAETGLRALAIDSEVSLPAVEIMLIAKARTLRAEDCAELYGESVKYWGLQPGQWTLRELIVCAETVEVGRQYAEDYKRLYPTDRKDEVGPGRSYNQLIEKCIEIREPDLAYRFAMQYARDLKRPGRPGSYTWFFSLFEQAVRDEDERIWEVVRLLVERAPRRASRAIIGAMERAQGGMMVERQPDEDVATTGRSFSGQLELLVKHFQQELVDSSPQPGDE